MDKLWTDEAWEDFLQLHSDRRLVKKLDALLKDIDRNGYSGIGKPEPLRDDLSGYWSRRIDDYNRIVYRIAQAGEKEYVEIIQCGTHYHK